MGYFFIFHSCTVLNTLKFEGFVVNLELKTLLQAYRFESSYGKQRVLNTSGW